MGQITLKEYLTRLDNYYKIINLQIKNIFNDNEQSFKHSDVNLIDATIIDDDSVFIKLELINYNDTNTNRIIEIYKVNDEISQIIYKNKKGLCSLLFEREQLTEELLEELLVIIYEYKGYFLNTLNKEAIFKNISKEDITDKLLTSVLLDEDKLPRFYSKTGFIK